MDSFQQLTLYIHKMVTDERLKPVHLSLSMALCHSWIESQFERRYRVSRKRLMIASHIRSKATYHKAIKELQQLGYLKYSPSYHPLKGSQITILIDAKPMENPVKQNLRQ
ncbi:MAG: hypothetical protein HOP08_05760 [Cyclobacteriaceae bacterium]|nr:hypothetical protein [Cyclobacteriaceae bacterium]